MFLYTYVHIAPVIYLVFTCIFVTLILRKKLIALYSVTALIALLLGVFHILLHVDIGVLDTYYPALHWMHFSCIALLLVFAILYFIKKAAIGGVLSLLLCFCILFNSFSWEALMGI